MSTMLYRYPGKHDIHGDKFDYVIVEDDKLEETLENAWYRTTAEAKEKSPLNVHPPADSAPTREELEIKATELGIKFRSNTKDETLSKKIQEALDVLD